MHHRHLHCVSNRALPHKAGDVMKYEQMPVAHAAAQIAALIVPSAIHVDEALMTDESIAHVAD